MRVKKASVNAAVNMLTFLLGSLPSFIVRKAFLDSLGNELLGLSSLYTNLIGLLSVMELGIGTAIVFSLYKPFAEQDYARVNGYLDYYRKFYRNVGGLIFAVGLGMTLFLPFFIKNQVNMTDARLYFVLFLINTLLSYLFSYKICVLNVAQESYKVSIATTASKLLISVLQVAMLMLYPSFYLFMAIQIAVNLVYYIGLNRYISRKYPWIGRAAGGIGGEERQSLVRNIKALFLHKIGGILVLGVDNLVISVFLNLTVVGIYNSYNLVIGAAQGLVSSAISGVTASVGNLLAVGSGEDAYRVHKRLFFLNFWIVSFITISLWNTIKQFVVLWLGDGQTLDSLTIGVVLANFYFFLLRGSVERFKEGGGVYHQDRFAPLAEAAINLIASVALAKTIGLAGVFLGTLLSNLLVIFWVKPLMVYKYIFKIRVTAYFSMYMKYLAIGMVPLLLTELATMHIKQTAGVYAFAENCLLNVVIVNVFYWLVFRKSEPYLYYRGLVSSLLKKKAKVSVQSLS